MRNWRSPGQDVYLLVDDAEQLRDGALEVLLLLAAGNSEARLHVFLFGEPSLLSRLEGLSEGEERFHAIELQPYTEEETREYLAQRLEGAGQGSELISEDLLADIHEQSGGWPGSINQVARDALIEAMLADRGGARKAAAASAVRLPKKHLLVLGVVAIGVVAAWFMQSRTSKPETPVQASATAQPGAAQVPASGSGSGPAVEFAGSNQPVPLPLVGESQPVIREPMAQAGGQEDADEGSGVVPSAGVPPTVTTAAPPVMPLASKTPAQPLNPVPPSPTAAVASNAPVQPVISTPQPAPVTKPAPVAKAEPVKPVAKPVSKPVEPKPVAKAATPSKPASAPAKASVASSGGSGSQWYRSQPAAHYSVQVLGTASEANAQAFIHQQGSGEYRYFRKTLQGKPLYVVTYGSFPSRAAAQAAVKGLSAKVQASKPWPRTFASIQQDIAGSH